ncbi:methyltransferase [Actinomadura harenae]|uniref:Class I SAM-dependent methyltransferase n=1 Tax=Actinomadura harenae TaxID=2483351 RepID=A0A3M2LMB3_9ACTN|nr:class I SAM-dependent methyltransferase [Actinomadura harenae]RMI38256.1 class I SAM-dependent methyltransferase [Actinomadura harenae]
MSGVRWAEQGREQAARWLCEGGWPPPEDVVVVDDELTADTALRLVREGSSLLWRGDFQNARQLLDALGRRVRRGAKTPKGDPRAVFHAYRDARTREASLLGRLLVPLDAGNAVPLRRAPDVRQAVGRVYEPGEPSVIPLRELLGILGAEQWRERGIEVPAVGGRIHPHYGVFAPTRQEYVDLVAQAPLPSKDVAFDIGTGTGVLAAVLARRGVGRVVATDADPRALACAQENVERLGLDVEIVRADLFPRGRAGVAVCNPPWLPGKAASGLDHAVYDPGGRMLHGYLDRLRAHLLPGGEGWLVLSDLAEHLGLRTREELLARFDRAGLRVEDRLDARPVHPRAADTGDPLHAARAAEVTSLWRLAPT